MERPLADMWILARPKVNYWGAYPSGFLERARALLGVGPTDPVLHVCGGRAKLYPFRGLGPHDRTLDLDPALEPDYCQDALAPLPAGPGGEGWPAILADPPYTLEDADHYAVGRAPFPAPSLLLKNCLRAVRPGGRVGFLHYIWPRPPQEIEGDQVRSLAACGVLMGFANRIRLYSVFERAERLDTVPAARTIRPGCSVLE